MKWHLGILAGAILGVLLLTMAAQVWLNVWQGDFFRAIEKKDLATILFETKAFFVLIFVLLLLTVCQAWIHERLKIVARQWLTQDLLRLWMKPAAAYRLGMTAEECSNPDQRIQEDTRNLTTTWIDLSVGLTHSSLLLASFIGVLWHLSSRIQFSWNGQPFEIPGYMVWVALIYASLGSWLAARVGRPLISLNEQKASTEADFRFSLVRMNENSERISFHGGEAHESRVIHERFENVQGLMKNFAMAVCRLTWVTSGYGWIMIVLPVIVALPGYLSGSLDLGGLMMVVGAFNQVQNSLRWFVDNFGRIADGRAALHRVAVFHRTMTQMDGDPNEGIQIQERKNGPLIFEKTRVSLQNGEVLIDEASLRIQPGERVLFLGESGVGKSSLFRAAAGLWPWGGGRIQIPAREDMVFVPQKPYMPLGTLAEALSYPAKKQVARRSEMERALRDLDLSELIPYLDQSERWDQHLSLGQQQLVAFARVLIQKPRWIFLDEATSALDEARQEMVMKLLLQKNPQASILSIAHRPGMAKYHHRVLHFARNEAGNVILRGGMSVLPSVKEKPQPAVL